VPVAEHKTLGHLGDILEKCAPDIIEFRLDGLIDCLEEASTVLSACHSPRLLTVRNPREGGLATGLDTGGRAALYLSHLAHTELIDIEMSSFTEIAEVVTAVKNSRALLVASLHDFTSMPDITHLEETIRKAHASGADICKIAVTPGSMGEVLSLAQLVIGDWPIPVSAMGMGTYGRISRLLCARAGSVLNYGYYLSSNAPGQWPAYEFKQLIGELFEKPPAN